jgi:hypothetical protein
MGAYYSIDAVSGAEFFHLPNKFIVRRSIDALRMPEKRLKYSYYVITSKDFLSQCFQFSTDNGPNFDMAIMDSYMDSYEVREGLIRKFDCLLSRKDEKAAVGLAVSIFLGAVGWPEEVCAENEGGEQDGDKI